MCRTGATGEAEIRLSCPRDTGTQINTRPLPSIGVFQSEQSSHTPSGSSELTQAFNLGLRVADLRLDGRPSGSALRVA